MNARKLQRLRRCCHISPDPSNRLEITTRLHGAKKTGSALLRDGEKVSTYLDAERADGVLMVDAHQTLPYMGVSCGLL